MVKTDAETIKLFNEYVNMTPSELETWLKSDVSESAGWPKNAGEEGGETVGHDSGRKIVEILRSNPKKDPKKYTEDQLKHMHKVVAYCARHLAQEGHMKDTKTPEELEKTKSSRSLKNWGHDVMKTLDDAEEGEEAEDEEEEEDEEGEEEEETTPSKKRKQDDREPADSAGGDEPSAKKAQKVAEEDEEEGDDGEEEEGDEEEMEGDGEEDEDEDEGEYQEEGDEEEEEDDDEEAEVQGKK